MTHILLLVITPWLESVIVPLTAVGLGNAGKYMGFMGSVPVPAMPRIKLRWLLSVETVSQGDMTVFAPSLGQETEEDRSP